MPEKDVLRRYPWTEQELRDEGFRYYKRRKEVVLAGELPEEEAPLTIKTEWETLGATASYVICFRSEDIVKDKLYDYLHWPVRADHFADLYRPWDEKGWNPTPSEEHLISLGCQPCFHRVGVWAKKLTRPAIVQSVESPEPIAVPANAWLCVGAEGSAWGSPYSTTEEGFVSRYDTSTPG
ncbi:MAG: hypothetical protein ABGY96_21555 [bacterium]|nr:hypothetical protein [Gammaproteobacteria bacterium]HIL97494.1 hypothetical protein [Pseudomonadales bacterium]